MHAQRPNIVLIHCHDLGTWLSCYGMSSIPSPNLQRLADNGIVFDKAFATAPLCTPARSSLFTGLLPHQNGLMGLTHAGWQYRSGIDTLPEMLGKQGYHSALIGLQHEDFDARVLGYDEVHGLGFVPRAMEVARRVNWWFDQPHPDQPFLLTIGMWEVHRPWPAEDYEPSDPDLVDVPAYLPDNTDTRQDISEFHGAIRQMDEAVGLMLEAIENSPYRDNTLILFTTDHGVAFPRAKSTLYDSGVQVSLIAQLPRQWDAPTGRRNHIVSHLDIAPTLIELAGGKPHEDLEGQSFRTVLQEPESPAEERELVLEKTYHDRYDPIRALRTSQAKYIRNFVPGPRLHLPIDLEESATRRGFGDNHLNERPIEELYLLTEDPWELNDVSADPNHAELKSALADRLHHHMIRTDDPLLEGEVTAPEQPTRALPNRVSAV
ncbi:sulfatase [uncultured Arthrobacter sp.]|uniref:sulfatase family protein n=1 Tax=uncultured Arthrobacter sp. TaxID=114050 RepID=UPI00262697FB|nr:sulfatase [uncultured Arthrobacter sp.]